MSDAILLVDDEPSVLSAIIRSLRGEEYEVVAELSGERALVRMAERTFKVVISDERMARMQGTEFLSIVRMKHPGTVRILLTGNASLHAAIRAVNEGGIYKFLAKPWSDFELKQAVREAIIKHDTEHNICKNSGMLKKEPQNLDQLEVNYPGISRLERADDGSLILPELSDEEMERLRIQCEQSFAGTSSPNTARQVRGALLQKYGEKRHD